MRGSASTEWRSNLRANLILWPDVAANIATLASYNGELYDEDQLIKKFPTPPGEKSPTDPRAVRNTFEIMTLAGLVYKDGNPPRLRLTSLGRAAFTFLGVVGSRRFINEGNRRILADAFIRAASLIIEQRAIWMLLLYADGVLTNEELNRAMARIRSLGDVPQAAEAIRSARRNGDPIEIGPRIYDEEAYKDINKREDQRKAMNPVFLLAGAGRLFISLEPEDPYRRLEDWAIPLIERRLQEASPLIHASTDPVTVRLMSEHACVPPEVW